MSPGSRRLTVFLSLLVGTLLLAVAAAGAQSPPDTLTPMEELGKALYFDDDHLSVYGATLIAKEIVKGI